MIKVTYKFKVDGRPNVMYAIDVTYQFIFPETDPNVSNQVLYETCDAKLIEELKIFRNVERVSDE